MMYNRKSIPILEVDFTIVHEPLMVTDFEKLVHQPGYQGLCRKTRMDFPWVLALDFNIECEELTLSEVALAQPTVVFY